MPRRSPREDRKAAHHAPGRNLSARARLAQEHDRREADEEPRLEREKAKHVEPRPSSAPAYVVCPSGKTGWVEHVARAKLAELAGSSRPRKPISVYLCHLCQSWHLTSSPERSA